MKKIFTLLTILALSTTMSYAASNFGKSLGNAIKADVNNTTKTFKNAVKADVNNAKKQNTAETTAKKQAKLKEINTKLDALNKEKQEISSKTYGITESERSLRLNVIQRQIDFYNKQKAALQ